jgi:hypothetical protein
VASALGQLKWHWFSRNSGSSSRLYDLQIFDNGSRGPLGAARLAALVSLGSLALPGAVITICLIAIDPLAQQLLTYPTRAVMTNSSQAWAPQARNLTSDVLDTVNTSAVFSIADGYNTQLGQFWIPTFYQGIFSGSKEIEAVCPTGNCTWPPFHTISWRPMCRDVTANISLGECIFSFDSAAPKDTTSSGCNLTIDDSQSQTVYAARTYTPSGSDNKTARTTISGSRSLIFRNLDVPSAEISMTKVELGYDDDEIRNGADIAPYVASATECRLDACVQQYSMSLASGQLEAHILSITKFSLPTDASSDIFSASVPSASGPGTPNIMFKVKFSVFISLAELTAHFLSGNTTQIIVDQYTDFSTNKTDSSYFYTPYSASSGILAYVFQYRGFEGTMDDIASQLTYAAHDMSTYRIYGAVGTVEPFVHVRWPWLALPLLIALSGGLFLTLTVFQATVQHAGMPIWKSSILPILPVGNQPPPLGDNDSDIDGTPVLYPSIEVTKNGEFRLRNQDLRALEVHAKAIKTVPAK